MFNIFSKKSEVDKLQKKYELLLKKSFEISKVNRTNSDAIAAEADQVLKKIEKLKAKD